MAYSDDRDEDDLYQHVNNLANDRGVLWVVRVLLALLTSFTNDYYLEEKGK